MNNIPSRKSTKINLIPIGGFKNKSYIANPEINENNPYPIKNSFFSSILLSLYDDVQNKFISLCIFEDITRKIHKNTADNLTNNLISFYPKNYEIPIYIKPDFLFKPLEIWEIEFDEIVDSDIFLTNYDINYTVEKLENADNFFIGKTLKNPRYIAKSENLKINEVTTLNSFRKIYADIIYMNNLNKIENDEDFNNNKI